MFLVSFIAIENVPRPQCKKIPNFKICSYNFWDFISGNKLTQGSFSNIMFPSGIIPDRVMNCFCWNFGYQIPGLIACTNLVGIDESWDIKNKG